MQDASLDDGRETVCALVLLNSSGDALLQLRDNKPGLSAAGLWVFPGGHAEQGESTLDCVKREFFEETAYECENPQWFMAIADGYLRRPATMLHVFWSFYVHGKRYDCQEGQALAFVPRAQAEEFRVPEYVIAIWDLAFLAARSAAQ